MIVGLRRGTSRAAALASGLVFVGCSERPASVPYEWPPPQEISQNRMNDNCVIVKGDLKCWAPPTTTAENATDGFLLLLGRDDPHPPPPLPTIDLEAGPAVLAVDRSNGSRCAAIADRGVKCWGENEFFTLALPDENMRLGDEPSEWGAGLPFVDLDSSTDVAGLASRGGGYCVRFTDGRVKCWGLGTAGLGLQDTETRGDDPGEMGDALPYVDLGTDVRAAGLSGGGGHVCVWTDAGRVKCWGKNDRGQLGVESSDEPLGDGPGEMGDALPFVDLGTDVVIEQVATGGEHTCALTTEGRVKCWGANSTRNFDVSGTEEIELEPSDFGRLGLGDHDDRRPPLGDDLPYVDLGNDVRAVAIAANTKTTCASFDDGRLKCWGNVGSVYGSGYEVRGDEPGEMGDALPYVDLGTERTVRAFTLQSPTLSVLLDDDSIKWFGTGETGDDLLPVVTAEDLYGPNR